MTLFIFMLFTLVIERVYAARKAKRERLRAQVVSDRILRTIRIKWPIDLD